MGLRLRYWIRLVCGREPEKQGERACVWTYCYFGCLEKWGMLEICSESRHEEEFCFVYPITFN